MGITRYDLTDDAITRAADWSREYTRVYQVFATIDMDAYAVEAALHGLGFTLFSSHPNDAAALLKSLNVALREPTQGTDPNGIVVYTWTATLSYGLVNLQEVTTTGNPINKPVQWRLDYVNTPQIVYEDVDGNPVVNSAGDYYDPPIERDFPRWTLTVFRNEPVLRTGSYATLPTMLTWANRTNEATWNGLPAKSVKVAPVKIPEQQYSMFTNQWYYAMEYVFEIADDTWVKQVLNQGYRQLDSTGKLEPIFINGQPASSPVMLDESGHALLTPGYLDSTGGAAPDEPTGTTEYSDGTGTGTGTATTVVVNAYEVYRPMDFGVLGMDSLF